MTDSVGNDERGERRPYLKPFVLDLDVVDTEGKSHMDFENSTYPATGVTNRYAPS
jgi:hypothetical protein